MQENDLKAMHQQLVQMKLRGMIIIGIFMLIFVTTLNRTFAG